MSVQSEIDRIKKNVNDTLKAIGDTGVQVGTGSDALPAAARALANEKQNKLTGTAGQFVGFDAEGNAQAQAVSASGIPTSEKGQPNGVATLDQAGKVPEAQIPERLSEQNLLSDKTAIGDLRMTTRNSVGEKWLLANGATISSEQYPQYAEKSIFTFAGEAKENLFYVPTEGINTMKSLQYVQGNLVCVTGKSIFYAVTPDAVWQESVIIQPSENGHIRGFAYGNGFYVVCGRMISPEDKSCIWYSRDIQGPWTAADIHQPNVTRSQGEFVRFINGQFVLKTSETIDSHSNSFLYAAETPDAQWSHVPLDFNSSVYHILYEEEKYSLVSAKEVSGSYYMGLMCATTLNGPWEFKKIDTNRLGSATCFTRINGKYIVFIAAVYPNSSNEHVYFSDSLDGPWKRILLPGNVGAIRDIVYDHGAYYAISASSISTTSPSKYYIHALYSENLESWTQAYQAQVYTNPGFVGILPFKNYMLCSAKELNAPGKSGIRYYDTRLRKLPSVTANGGAKVFIQVK